MKTKAFIFFSLLICNLLPAQNIKLDITPHFLGVRADSLLLSMDVSVEIENMESKNAVRLTPVLTGKKNLTTFHLIKRQTKTEIISA
jgi:hypothetical protein